MFRTVVVSATFALALGLAPSLSASEPTLATAAAQIDTALRSREYAHAIELIDAALKSAEGPEREHLLFRRGLALHYQGEHASAIEQFAAQLEQFPDGPWSHKARFRQADAHVALKQFEAAEQIYAERVRALVGDARKARIARVYLDFATEYFSPPDPLTQADYAKARTFYERALELEPGEALRDEILYRRALCNQKLEAWADAAAQYEQYLLVFDADYRDARKLRNVGIPLPTGAAEPGQQRVAARFGLGECRLKEGNLVEARRTWQDLLTLLEREDPQRTRHGETRTEATYLLSKTHQMPQPPDTASLTLGVQILESLLNAAPASRQAIWAAYDIGKAYAHLGRHDEAIAALRALIERERIRPESDETRELAEAQSQEALFTIGQLYSAQKKYDDAIGAWSQYVAKYPNGPQWSAAQQAIVDAEFQIGLDAMADKRHEDARQAWTSFLQSYPLDRRAPLVLLSFGNMVFDEQVKLEKDGKTPNWNAAIADWRRLVNKYPDTEESGQAQFRIAATFENKIQDLDAAIVEYAKLSWSSWAERAREREREMKATRLNVFTERAFRTDEPARIRVDTRNIDTLTVKLYRIDPEDYFRKRNTLHGVENLDLLLIDPDRTFDVPVEGYAPYKPITREVEIPFDGPGVFAVNVSNENSGKKPRSHEATEPRSEDEGAKLEATTLLVRSDIDVIVKTSRRAVLVFAQNMRTNEPAAGVHAFVSDGQKVVLTGETGDDGVWLTKSIDMKHRSLISVFAERAGHVAGDALSLDGLGISTGLTPHGYIYTDRPAYRPGDAVNVRGVLREVREGQYVRPAEPEDERLCWKLDVVDPKGRVLTTEPIRLSEFGTCTTQFRVAADAPVGEYRLIARRPDGPTFTGAFRVETYQLAKAHLDFEFDERVVMRGEKITGTIVAKYHYGEPVVGKTIEYSMELPTGESIQRSGVTDASGKIAIEFESGTLPEEARVWFRARQAELGVEAGSHVWVAVRAFTAEVSTLRPLLLSEEPVEVTVSTKDRKGEPIAKEMTLTALLRTRDRDTWAETKIETLPVQTDAKTGRGRATLKLAKGGTYVLRAEGKDRFDHVVTAETTVQISDADDATRVRVFSDRQHYKVGETIGLDVHSRLGEGSHGATEPRSDEGDAPPLALITYEGEEVVGYRTLKLEFGHNRYDLPVEHAHFPNFAVGVAVMDGNRFHTASRHFTVERQLNITLTPNQDVYRPRDELELDVHVTDQHGDPVAAEIGLAMIDNALLARYPDMTPDIVAFFQEGAQRHAAMRTATSCTFRYQGETRAMVTEVLAEAERVAQEGRRFARAHEELMASQASDVARLRLQSADALQVHEALTDVLRRRADAEGSVRLEVEPITNSLVVMGEPAAIEEISSWIENIDKSAGTTVEAAAARPRGRRVRPQSAQLTDEVARQLEALGYVGSQDDDGDGAFGQMLFGGAGGRAAGYFADRSQAGRLFFADATVGDSFDGQAAGLSSLAFGYEAGREVRTQVEELIRERFTYEARNNPAMNIDAVLGEIVRGAPPRTYFPELAYWNPQVTTDETGHATVRIVLPDSNTKWKLIARGVTAETLVGASEAEVISKTDFFVELLTPPTVIEGDKLHPAARVHCLTPFAGKIDLTLRVHGAESSRPDVPRQDETQLRTVIADGSGVYDVDFDAIEVATAGELIFDISAETRGDVPDAKRPLQDAIALAVPVRPWGLRIEAHAAGLAGDSEFVEVELPRLEGTSGEFHDRRLTVAVGSSMQRWLIEEALESGDRWKQIERSYRCWSVVPPRTHADTASSLVGCLYAGNYLRATEQWSDKAAAGNATADYVLLNERVAGLVAQLLSAQNEDGGWAWTGKDQASDSWTSAYVAWALGKARCDGHPVADDAAGKLGAYLQKTFADARPDQTELKAVVLHGLSWIDKTDFAHANRLYRNRQALSSAALAQLALTFVRLERNSIAAELLGVLEHRTKEVAGSRGQRAKMLPAENSSAWLSSDLEVTALALLAQLSVDPRAAGVRSLVEYLAGATRVDGWRPHKARGAVLAALATYYGGAEQQAADYTLTISINGREVRKLTSGDVGSALVELGEPELLDGKQRVDFTFSGRGEYAYAVTLSGFSRDYPDSNAVSHAVLRVEERRVSPPPLEYKGRAVNAGFSVTREHRWFRNGACSQPVGAVLPVALSVQRYDRSDNAAGDRDYVIVQETIPAGFRLLTETVSGSQLAYDYANNVLTLYFGSRRDLGWIRYSIVATTPGTYRLPATIARSLYRPEVMHLNPADQVLTVLPRGTGSPDEYRMTPDELYHLGRMHFDDGDYAASGRLLRELLAGEWLLNDEPYRESIRMLLNVALAQNDAEGTVNYFEILKEKYPELVIPFAQIIRVADAYARTNQHERAYLIYRATADASFANDTAVAGVLQDEGSFLESIDLLDDLWREYPDTPQVESVCYAISQTLYAQAAQPTAIKPRRGDAGGRVTRDGIIGETIALLERFLALYPESPIGDEASYSLANAYLDLDRFDTVLSRTERMIKLFPDSRWLDRFRYIQALALFNLANFDQARELAQQVAEATYRDEQGVVRPSPNKWLALYIIGQIYHAQGRTADALEFYKKVKSHFSDADEAISYFEHKFVELPEVTIFHPDRGGFRETDEWNRSLRKKVDAARTGTDKPELRGGKPAPNEPEAALHSKPFIQLDYRNIETAVLQVYRVDLMKLALVEKNLAEITSVNLAGIKPLLEKTVTLGDGHDYVDKTLRVELELPCIRNEAAEGEDLDPDSSITTKEAAGAYLVICRGDDRFSSGLVLITPLALEVQDDRAGQRVRVTVMDAISRKGLKNVHVEVIGTGMSRFVPGETDLRGVYSADAVLGHPTTIARDAEGHFAFHRSEGALLAMAQPETSPAEAAPAAKAPGRGDKADYRGNLSAENRMLQDLNTQKLRSIFKQQQKGVQVQTAQ